MSSADETSVVLRGITHGAVDYLLKPVRLEELRNLWQHVVRRRHASETLPEGASPGGGTGSPPRLREKRHGGATEKAGALAGAKERRRDNAEVCARAR